MGCSSLRKVIDHQQKNKNFKKNSSVSGFSNLPSHLVVEILARLAASSSNDFFNSKLCSKEIYELSDDDYIYKHVCLDRFRVPLWPTQKEAISFLERCRESGNPEALFRQGVVDYFGHHNKSESGIEYLKKSANSGHLGASYVLGVILFCSSDKSLKQQGMKLLDHVKVNRRLGYCRRRLEEIRSRVWLNRLHKIEVKPNCCPMQEQHKKKEGWPNLSIDDEENKFGCNECSFSREVRLVSELF